MNVRYFERVGNREKDDCCHRNRGRDDHHCHHHRLRLRPLLTLWINFDRRKRFWKISTGFMIQHRIPDDLDIQSGRLVYQILELLSRAPLGRHGSLLIKLPEII